MFSELKGSQTSNNIEKKWVSTHQKILVCYIDVSTIL